MSRLPNTWQQQDEAERQHTLFMRAQRALDLEIAEHRVREDEFVASVNRMTARERIAAAFWRGVRALVGKGRA